ncbi:MAG: hypothetical protein LBI36_02535 [Oscillospiraceae bacterium]|jgi:D-alanine--D-alanine ligase|nr:hypothetical protein [Oscillospiraceae bacterium]
MLNVALICGGPSKECSISLNSARSIYDHMRKMPDVSAQIVFMNEERRKYLIDETFLYSNTTSDFKFMLHSQGNCIDGDSFLRFLKGRDLAFPVMHGKYGEDGELQRFLEDNGIPHVASPAKACEIMYSKRNAEEKILKAGNMFTIPKLFLYKGDDLAAGIKAFFGVHGLKEAVLKPIEGGSSIGVEKAANLEDAVKKAEELTNEYGGIVVEKLCRGREFTVIILERDGVPVALLPTEIEILDKDGKSASGEIFDRRKKYMPTTETRYYCPAGFDDEVTDKIRDAAQYLFSFAGARDFLRIDGWLLDGGEIYFSDFNPVSGMEQNSFIFQQAAVIGFSHGGLIRYILRNACARYKIPFNPVLRDNVGKRRVNVLMGGVTSERQVSVLSGTNTWLKLLNSSKYHPVPYILTSEGGALCVYEIPYATALNHTAEEIHDKILNTGFSRHTLALKDDIITELGAENTAGNAVTPAVRLSPEDFFSITKSEGADVFICLHGGFGENGTLQKLLEERGIHFNGSGWAASRLCMDKYATGERVNALGVPNLRSCRKKKFDMSLIRDFLKNPKNEWESLCGYFGGEAVVVKPNSDGCSTGIVVLRDAADLKTYGVLGVSDATFIPENTFYNQPNKIQLPKEYGEFLFEEYIETAEFEVKSREVVVKTEADWVELTVGVLEKGGEYHSMNPSVTIADNDVLGVEEKFQGGSGINLTPPPEHIIGAEFVKLIKKNTELVAKACGVGGYCRIDIFANNKTREIIIIEINSLPGLSPSTVLFQQGAKEVPPLYPTELLEYIISE